MKFLYDGSNSPKSVLCGIPKLNKSLALAQVMFHNGTTESRNSDSPIYVITSCPCLHLQLHMQISVIVLAVSKWCFLLKKGTVSRIHMCKCTCFLQYGLVLCNIYGASLNDDYGISVVFSRF